MGRNARARRGRCYYEGIKYRSLLEKETAKQLQHKVKRYDYESDQLEYWLQKKYLTDFYIVTTTGNKFFLEVKGRLTQDDRRKYLAVKQYHPSVDLRFLFGANNKLTKVSKIRYLDWAEKHEFPACVKQIPKEWLE